MTIDTVLFDYQGHASKYEQFTLTEDQKQDINENMFNEVLVDHNGKIFWCFEL